MDIHLRNGEEIVQHLRESPRHALNIGLMIGVLVVAAPVLAKLALGEATGSRSLLLYALSGAGVGLVNFLLRYQRLEVLLTTQRLLLREGLMRRTVGDYAFADILSIDGLQEHEFDVKTADGMTWRLFGLPNLARFRENLTRAIAGSSAQG